MRTLLAPLALCAAALAVGCANNSVVGGVPDAAADVPVSDISARVDASSLDAPTIDAVDVTAPDLVDAPPGDLGPTPCTRSEQCVGDPAGPACDTARGRCVPCTDAEDRCPTGQYCVPMMQSCQPGCRDDNACVTAAGDGGVTRRRCDLSSRQCVECVIDDHCPAGNLCVGNLCVAGCSGTRACPTGQTCCMGGCVDTQSNTASCGACGARCAVLNATAVCMNGQCGYSACTAPFGDCDRDALNGCESNLLNDTSHCGACGMACGNRANASARCEAGACRYTCNAGFEDCDGDARNGCETDTRTTATACGACGNRCALANAESTCVDGRCAVGRCAANFGDCDGNALNGCEADLRTSVAHCGFCNTSCPGAPNAVPACAVGTCAITCTAGFADCDGRLDNGCEVNTRSDVGNCGACSNRCTVSSGTAACVSGACRVDTCTAPFGDCDGNVSNGCEVDTSTSAAHCGACGNACATGAACVSGQCERTGVSCAAILAANPGAPSGVYLVDPDGNGSQPGFRAYCDMVTEGGGWTFVATVTNNGDAANQGNWRVSAPVPNSWESSDASFGTLDPTLNQDYRSVAFHRVAGRAVMITHRNAFLLRTDDACLPNTTLRDRFAALGWTCGGSASFTSHPVCTNPCVIARATPRAGDTAMLNGVVRARLYLKAGEADGAQDTNRDRVYLSTDYRDNVDFPTGLGAFCSGSSCSPRTGDADVNDRSDAITPTAGSEFYGIWVR